MKVRAKPKRQRGRPEGTGYHPTPAQREQVELMAACGIPEEDMVVLIINPKSKKPISPVTLRKHFREELDRGILGANMKVIGGLFKNATTKTKLYPAGNPILQIFWAKCRLRWNQSAGTVGGLLGDRSAPPPLPDEDIVPNFELARRIAFALSQAIATPKPVKKGQPA